MTEYRKILNWYEYSNVEIPEQVFFVMKIKNIMIEKRVFGVLEKFDNSQRVDLFSKSEGDVMNFSFEDSFFYKSMTDFVDKTLMIYDREGQVVDLLGDCNVCIINSDKGKKICLTDPHTIFDTRNDIDSYKSKKRWEKLLQRIAFLRNIQQLYRFNRAELIQPNTSLNHIKEPALV